MFGIVHKILLLSSMTGPQDAHKRLVLHVYLGLTL